jgi:hypothetical protein
MKPNAKDFAVQAAAMIASHWMYKGDSKEHAKDCSVCTGLTALLGTPSVWFVATMGILDMARSVIDPDGSKLSPPDTAPSCGVVDDLEEDPLMDPLYEVPLDRPL